MILAIGAIIALGGWFVAAQAVCTDTELADVPLELKSRSAPGLIGMVLENTRSLYYTIMTDAGGGTYKIDGSYYEHVFEEKTRAGSKYLDTNEKRNHWKTQWSGYNTTYYDPTVTYVPWPRWNAIKDSKGGPLAKNPPASAHANPDTPRIWPLDDATFDLNADFSLIPQSAGTPTAPTIINPWGKVVYRIITYGSGSFNDWGQFEIDQGSMSGWNYIGSFNKPKNDTNIWIWSDSIWLSSSSSYSKYAMDTIRLVVGKGEFHSDDPVLLSEGKLYKTHNGMEIISDTNNDYYIDQTYPDNTRTFYTSITSSWSIYDHIFLEVPMQAGDYELHVYIPYPTQTQQQPPPTAASGDISVKRAHYYIKSKIDGNYYLVNFEGDTATGTAVYYQLMDGNKNVVETTADIVPVASPPADVLVGDYKQARQNFANWYQFYRSRADSAIGALGQFVNDLSGVYFRLDGFPPASFGYNIQPIKVVVGGNFYDESDTVLSYLYILRSPSAETVGKLHSAYERTGDFFINKTQNANLNKEHASFTTYSSSADFPYFTKDYGGECQQAFAILVTGGFWTTKSNELTLADMAKSYWDTDFRSNLADLVPVNDYDENRRQHLVTYGISFGVEGKLIPEQWPNCNLPGGFVCPVWPKTIASQTNETIDDLWHATVEGRGLFINASNPQKMVEALKAIRSDIERRLGAAAAVSTNSVQRQTGTHLYQGTYNSTFWSGDLLAKPIDAATGAVQAEIWSAQKKLDDDSMTDWKLRKIYTFDGAGGISFDYSSLNPDQKTLLNTDPLMVDYLRGDRSLELKNGGPFRNRASRLGDIVHSEPVYHEKAVYIGANDGMLHAFAAEDSSFAGYLGGQELFAYIPDLVFDHLADLASPSYDHLYYVNNTPYAKNIDGTSYLVGGLSKGGKGIYCLNVTDPASFSTTDVEWEYSAVKLGDDDLGYTFSRPFIVNTKAAGWVVVFGNGYNSVNGEAVLYVLSVTDGSVVKKIPTGVKECNGIVANAAIIDPNSDGYADYVYVGDLKGNMWKFDISGATKDSWGVAFTSGTASMPLFTAKNASGNAQRITAAADVMRHCDSGSPGYIVIFGTGQYVNEGDFNTTDTQTLYGIWDTQPAWEYLKQDPKIKNLGEFTATLTADGDRMLSNPEWKDYTLLEQTGSYIGYGGKTYFAMSENMIDYWDIAGGGLHLGWYFDMPTLGQRVIRDPMIRDGVVVFIASTPVQTPCSSGGSSVLFQIDACSGGKKNKALFDTDGDDKVESDDVIKDQDGNTILPSGLFIDEMLYKPVDIKDRLYIADDSADILEVPVPPVVGGMLYWRETDIRR